MMHRRWRVLTFAILAIVLLHRFGLAQETKQAEGAQYVPRPQDPKGQPPYFSEDVSYPSEAPEIAIAGTFTRPKGEQPVPAVLLLSSAGPQDRDETMAGHKPFLVLSDYLTRHGIAVLRSDDRGTGKSTGSFQHATMKDFAADAAGGFGYLADRPDINKKRIGLIGHGEGGIVAAMVAAANPRVGFLVLINGTAVTGDQVLLAQTQRAETAAGLPEEQVDADLRLGAGFYRMIREGRSAEEMREAFANVPPQYAPYAEAWKRRISRLDSRWLRFFLIYDPSVALEKVQCPVLALFGEKDMTIDPDQNASAMKKAFSLAHNRNTKIKTLPNLNDMLQKANTGMASEYSDIQETISPAALEMIESWISKETN